MAPVPTSLPEAPSSRILHIGFNQDQTCLAIGTLSGFQIFSTENFVLLHEEVCGAVAMVEMLFRTSLLAFVGHPCADPALRRQLTMWNTTSRSHMCRLEFDSQIHAIRMNHRRVVVLLQLKIHIFELRTMRSLHVIDRLPPSSLGSDSLGLSWLCASSGYLATPLALPESKLLGGSPRHGWNSVHSSRSGSPGSNGTETDSCAVQQAPDSAACDMGPKLGLVTIWNTYTLKLVGTVLAHRSPVQALCLNPTGQILATASARGTVIRLFGLPALEMLFSFRRGTSPCQILGLGFSRDSSYLCAPSSSGTVHIFKNSEQLLSSLPLHSEEATVGAVQRELEAKATVGAVQRELAAKVSAKAEDFSKDGDWQLLDERADRELELYVNPVFAAGPGLKSSVKRTARQTLSAVSDFAFENTTKYAKSLMRFLPQPCRELVDAPRAFAWVHLRDEEPQELRKLNTELCLQAMGCAVSSSGLVACLRTTWSSKTGRAEVLAISPSRSCAHVYDWSLTAGGACRLRSEHSLSGQRSAAAEQFRGVPRRGVVSVAQ
eukprot:TRINITY_DN16010_c0_g1_i1.p1 TRINITY_DN16010_c0_g1~~TRINITY_DN16010_c0_g1_i1.p1  ORF type:complete len:547 (+),score=78.14 TRINITY_DN16010_c0_g1_i1:31-1671(+)